MNTFVQDYAVDTNQGFVTFTDPGGGGGNDMLGAIGPSAQSFIFTATAQDGGAQPNDQRFLGLGLRQAN